MLEKIIFRNHEGESLETAIDGIYYKYNDLRDYKWGYSSNGRQITGFNRGIVEKTVPLVILCNTEQEGIDIKNKLFMMAEKDVLANQPGRFIVGDYYLLGYVTGAKMTKYLYTKSYMEVSITFATSSEYWVKEHIYSFGLSEVTSNKNKRYAGRYPYRYANGLSETFLINEHYAECNFRMNIYGPCTKPSVYIGGYGYHFNIVLQEGEYLEIDSAAETVTKVMNFGIRANAFHYRNFENTVFRPIQTGRQSISWDGKFSFDIVLLEERSTPKWS